MKTFVGCFATLAWFALIAVMMLGAMMGDCFPEMGHACPTDRERNLQVLAILLVGIGIYLLTSRLLTRLARRHDDGEGA